MDKKPEVSSSSASIVKGHIEDTTVAAIDVNDGYKHDLRKNFNIWSLLGVGFGLTNSWFGISASLVTGISSGGPLMIVYGIIIVACISVCIGISLSELVSAFPENSGGQYYWTFQLAPKKYRRFWAYMCGSYAWFGSIFTTASVTISIASAIVGMYYLSAGKDSYPKTWEVFVTFELLNAFLIISNIWEKPLPAISSAALYTSLTSFIVITITVLACSSGHFQAPSFVFSEFQNGTGWSSSGIAFIVGLINPAWSFSCLDCATHMAEEIFEPERWIPISILSTVAIGFVTSFCYSIAMFFSIRNLDSILSSTTGVPILDIFYQALGNKGGAIFLECLIVLTAFGCNIACMTWQARLCWSFSRDDGIPGSRYWSKVNETTKLPVNAHVMSCFWCSVVGCIYMGSTTAYNAMVTGCITFLLLSYAIPICCLLYKGRNSIKHGPFWLGPLGLVANIVTLCWTLFACIFFSFPSTMPVTKDNMNYACVVLFGMTIYAVAYWHLRGHKRFALEHSDEDDDSVSLDLIKPDAK
jgi:choline transport protein